ncbi:hypothetical protein GOP47_0029029 [Adiantum capillus-veneris]|nr:hypothetical protein GOP47_0029029 [Adiantum capillus-veneris]
MGTRAEVQEPPISPIPPQDYPHQAAESLSALSLTAYGCSDALNDAPQSPASTPGGVQEACDDSCSICLEPFCESDPATITSCKHDYHLQCILEWAQRSKECPMCWQALSFEDPNSQELFDAIEQERSPPWMRHSQNGFQFNQVPAFANYADFEERIMQHLAHQLARRGRVPGMYDEPYVHSSDPALLRPSRAFMEQPMHEARQAHNHSFDTTLQSHSNEAAFNDSERRNVASETVDESHHRSVNSDFSSLSESLKSRFLVASSKWKDTFTKTTHGFKEKWRARTNSSPAATDLRARAQGVSAEVVRQAIRRIAPDNGGKDNDSSKVLSRQSFGMRYYQRCLTSNARCDRVGRHVRHHDVQILLSLPLALSHVYITTSLRHYRKSDSVTGF